MFGNGNCLFRSFSYAIYSNQDFHLDLRNKLVGLLRSNKHKFDHLIMQHASVEQHINQMCKLGTWGTQVEIFAMATLYNMPVYVASQNPKYLNYSWCKYTPINVDDCTSQEIRTNGRTHVEIIHMNGNHFDAIEPINTSNCSEPIFTQVHKQGGVIE